MRRWLDIPMHASYPDSESFLIDACRADLQNMLSLDIPVQANLQRACPSEEDQLEQVAGRGRKNALCVPYLVTYLVTQLLPRCKPKPIQLELWRSAFPAALILNSCNFRAAEMHFVVLRYSGAATRVLKSCDDRVGARRCQALCSHDIPARRGPLPYTSRNFIASRSFGN